MNQRSEKGTESSNDSPPANESTESIDYGELLEHTGISGRTRAYLTREGTGEHSPPRSTARKFDDFSVREFASPLSCRSEIEPNAVRISD